MNEYIINNNLFNEWRNRDLSLSKSNITINNYRDIDLHTISIKRPIEDVFVFDKKFNFKKGD